MSNVCLCVPAMLMYQKVEANASPVPPPLFPGQSPTGREGWGAVVPSLQDVTFVSEFLYQKLITPWKYHCSQLCKCCYISFIQF